MRARIVRHEDVQLQPGEEKRIAIEVIRRAAGLQSAMSCRARTSSSGLIPGMGLVIPGWFGRRRS